MFSQSTVVRLYSGCQRVVVSLRDQHSDKKLSGVNWSLSQRESDGGARRLGVQLEKQAGTFVFVKNISSHPRKPNHLRNYYLFCVGFALPFVQMC